MSKLSFIDAIIIASVIAIIGIGITLFLLLYNPNKSETANPTFNTQTEQIITLTDPVLSIGGKVSNISNTAISITTIATPSSEFSFILDTKTKYLSRFQPLPYRFRKSISPEYSYQKSEIKVGDNITVETNQDLRTTQDKVLAKVVAVNFPRQAFEVMGKITEITQDSIQIFRPDSANNETFQEANRGINFTIKINADTEIVRADPTNAKPPQLLAITDLVPGDILVAQSLTAIASNTMEASTIQVEHIIPAP